MTGAQATILLLTKNAGPELELLFERCRGQRVDVPWEMIVVDSGSTDGTVERVKTWGVRLVEIPPGEFGHGRTRNYAARLADAAYVVYLTQDAIPADETWLAELLRPFADPQVAGVYGRQIPKENAHPFERFFLATTYHERREVRRSSPGGSGRWRVRDGFFSNVSSAIRREVLLRVPFDETLVMSEDQQWARDAIAAGNCVVYQPTSVVRHSHGYTVAAAMHRSFDSGASLRDITEDSLIDVAGGGLGYVTREAWYLVKSRYWRWLPLLPIYEGARFLGFFFGRHAHVLPQSVNRRLSQYSWFWK